MSGAFFPKGIRGWAVLLATGLTMVVTASLGCWQLGRAAQKQALVAVQTQQAHAVPWDNAAWRDAVQASAPDATALLHHPVQLRGRWSAANTLYLDNRQMQGRPGFYVLTPLLLEGGGAVLVQRGWIARNFQDRTQLAPVQTDSGPVQIQGRVAPAPAALYALGGDVPDAAHPHIRQNVQLAALAQETGLPLAGWSVVQTGAASDGLLRDWPQPDAGVAKHQGYAFQWFGLCALAAILYVWFQLVRPRRRAATAA